MAQVDSRIALGVQPVQIENPVNQLARVMQIQGLQQAQGMNALKMDEYRRGTEEKNALRAVLGREGFSIDSPDSRNALLRASPEKGAAILKSYVDAQNAATTGKKAAGDLVNQRVAAYRDNVYTVGDPQTAAQFVTAIYNDPDLKGSAITAVPLETLLSSIPQDPSQIGAWKQQFALGATKFMELNKPTIATRNLGGTTDTISTEGLTGVTRTLNSAQNTQSPDSVASVAAQRENAAARREQAAAARDANAINKDAARTEIKETADGFVMIDKGTGKTTPLAGADGKPLGPKLKTAPPGVQNAVLSNSQNLARAERALALVEGKNIGDPAKGGQLGDKEATGWKGYLPNQVLNRVDPTGVDARAAIADLGSLVIHDRSGAAVTAAEFPRLAPFIPTEKDDAPTVKKKLQRFVQVYREELAALEAAYNPDTGYKPPGGAGKPAGGTVVDFGSLK